MFREAARIGRTLADLIPSLAARQESSEVILVDDGSDDGTVAAAAPWVGDHQPGLLRSVRIVRHAANRGKGAAVRTGLGAASGRWRLVMDADNACRVSEVDRLAEAARRTGAALVVGSRLAPGAVVRSRVGRRLFGGVFRACLRILGLAFVRDTQCGFKLYRADMAGLAASVARENGFAFDLEHLLLARTHRLGIAEVGITWSHVDGGTVRPVRDGLRMLARAAVIRLRSLRGGGRSMAGAQVEAKPAPAVPPAPAPREQRVPEAARL